ncbi:RING zinc finger-containing protein [Planoprotostelium fungivorum]|uniref:RING zinc finger-containing protein n=1 Tax=Planoprotostelium fungivorum TaxID=1890364 RepID=A0A2P6NSC4_9EUKA|nr:RING zinc finger-containing protein [Planoprotostelium fungivorum]
MLLRVSDFASSVLMLLVSPVVATCSPLLLWLWWLKTNVEKISHPKENTEDPAQSITMTDLTWESMNLASRVSKQIENADSLVPRHQANAAHPAQDLQELVGTINYVRTALVPFVESSASKAVAPEGAVNYFDICIRGLKDTLNEIFTFMKDLEKEFSVNTWKTTKVKLYKLDFLVKQKLDQFIALFTQPEMADSAKRAAIDGMPSSRGPPQLEDLIADPEGRSVWIHFFGETVWFVPWADFLTQMENAIGFSMREEEEFIKNTINFTRTNYVSAYEFGVYLKWFGPFSGSFHRLVESIKGGILCGFIPAIEANLLLEGKREGTYLIRCSKTQPGSFAVTFVDHTAKIKHCLLFSVLPYGLTLKNPPTVYPSLRDFLELHLNKLKHPLGNKWTAKMKLPGFAFGQVNSGPRPPMAMDEPQGAPGSPKPDTLESNQCIVCMDAPLETVFLECGHLACCQTCSVKLKLCPMCRLPISRVVPIFRAN